MTEWHTKFSFWGVSLNFVPSTRRYYLNHWEIHYAMPSAVLFTIYSSLCVYFTCQRSLLPDLFGAKTSFFLIVTSLLFGYCYISLILVGPGYLPFYYPLENPVPNTDNSLSGMVTNDGQLSYLRNSHLPARTGYFSCVKRVVIRPDHYCGWAEAFIGKKNHKLFCLFNFWGLAYISAFIVTTIISIVNLLEMDDTLVPFGFCVLYAIAGFVFAFVTGRFLLAQIYDGSINDTQFEQMKGVMFAHRGRSIVGNWEEICGPASLWYLWLVPVPAFSPRNDRELLTAENFRDSRHLL
jgi:hypothetical protein